MKKIWVISDTHFGHNNMYKFTNTKGELERPWAADAAEGDSIMIELWNSRVKANDRVYHLGDVAIPKRAISTMSKLNGKKVLIRGNHDIFKLKEYVDYFDDIRGSHKLNNVILSHYPIHADSIPHWSLGNVHGHLHSNIVLNNNEPDNRYTNVSVEHSAGAPIEWDELYEGLRK